MNMFISSLPFRTPFHALMTLTLASFLAMAGALISQYGFGWAPCHLCLWQRGPHVAVIVLGLLTLLLLRHHPVWIRKLLLGCSLIMLLNAGIGTYHSLVERHIIAPMDTCTHDSAAEGLDALRAQILGTKAARCDIPADIFPGFSMANANVLWCLCLGIAGFLRWRQTS